MQKRIIMLVVRTKRDNRRGSLRKKKRGRGSDAEEDVVFPLWEECERGKERERESERGEVDDDVR